MIVVIVFGDRYFLCIKLDKYWTIMSPTKSEGDILVSVRIPGIGVGMTVLYPPCFLKQWVEFYQTCMDTLLGQAKELFKFW